MNDPDKLEAMLAQGTDNALIRFGLGQAWLHQGEHGKAIAHLRQALAHESDYTAAWKLLGKALAADGHIEQAIHAFEQGIHCAEKKGDQQAMKEMQVFLKRLA